MSEVNEMENESHLQRYPSTMSIQPVPTKVPNPSLCSHSPSLSPSLSAVGGSKAAGPQITHSFQEHVFRKPTSCQLCKHMIVGNSKQALRCKTCKIAAHLWCTSELSQQLCHGKSGAFKRNFSSPVLINDQLAVVKEVQPSQGPAIPENDPLEDDITESRQAEMAAEEISVKVPKVHSVHTYVALYRFLPQEPNDLPLQVRPGERVWRVTQSIHGNRERGHMPVKEDQICVGKQENSEGYMRLSSGKKRGLVPADSMEEI
ncbi:hypothetical protein CRUP_004053 [Coryphaenoides rupestris]|nr:hypothetical protein CRUP_004053 [Coryphaenoides rupestris]